MNEIVQKIKKKAVELLASSHGLAEVMRFEHYAAVYDSNCYHLLETDRRTTVLMSEFVGEHAMLPEPCKLPDLYWAELTDASIIGGSDVVLTANGKLLYDMLASSDEYNANITDYGLMQLGGKPHHIGKHYIYSFRHTARQNINKGISLASNMSNNYFHFLFQVASRMIVINNLGIERTVPLLVDERVLRVPQMGQVLDCLNEEHREIIPLSTDTRYKVGKLYCIANPNIIIPNRKKHSPKFDRHNAFAFDKKTLNQIKSKILSAQGKDDSSSHFPKRIFLSRTKCSKRRINEDDLRPVLEKYNFEFVHTEDMDVFTQAKLFNHAEHIIGGSGAAFANLVFCSKGCKVLMFFSRRHNSSCFSSLSNISGAIMKHISGSTSSNDVHAMFYSILPKTLESYLNSIYS
ncbi:MAG: glycosyltransferase family 61 protein [Paludibacteraceae bacterium]|nr:glycosyltransferase family 61 protein [Paludibacteraceae bacterium]